ncbi:hypothetical protein KP509_37G070300 [Ceratopteris richardii]|nr:hypothetical protein KP509_37G070300 [Ceratopteris richardii]
MPQKELPPLILGEWWNANVEDVSAQALATGGAYNVSDALTINGQPGDLYNCSSDGTFVYHVSRGRVYMLRIINAALNFQMYFAIANHTLTVVEADAEYTQELLTDMIILAPGQTTNVLFTTNKSSGDYYIAASVYSTPNAEIVPFPQTPTTAILRYEAAGSGTGQVVLPSFPLANDSSLHVKLSKALKGKQFSEGFYHFDVPQTVDYDLLHTIGYALQRCAAPNETCMGQRNIRFRASMNNISFVSPDAYSILEAHYNHVNGVYTTNFPDAPYFKYDYTAVNPINKAALSGTRVRVIPFNSTVQVVYQDTATLFIQSHPMHLHGQNFYIVGTGNGTYNPKTDPATFNLVNPPSRNTVSVYPGGWAAVRFRAINPGAWLVHCHFDIHMSWGMDMVFITLNGKKDSEILPPPPKDLPKC